MTGEVLDKVLVEKDLGIMVSSDVKSSQQCVVACNKANRVWGMIRRTISYKARTMDDGQFIHCGSKKTRQLWRTITTTQFSRF